MLKNLQMKRACRVLLFIVIAGLLVRCSPKIAAYTGEKSFKSETGIPDYSNLDYWASHPAKWDPADTIPGALKEIPGWLYPDVPCVPVEPPTA